MATDPKTEEDAIRAYVRHLLAMCVNLVRGKPNEPLTEPIGLASGFLVKQGGKNLLLSAGHAVRKQKWYWELPVDLSHQRRSLCLPVGGFTHLKSFILDSNSGGISRQDDVDFGWCEIDTDALEKQFRLDAEMRGKSFSIYPYVGPLDGTPELNEEIYSFAAWNRGTLIPMGATLLERDYSCELGMRFVGTDSSDRYVFKPGDRHKGHEYYRGASGAAISDPSGRIISMVLGGCEEREEIYGLPLARFAPLLSLVS